MANKKDKIEVKQYTFKAGFSASQEMLNVEQDQQIMELLSDFGLAELDFEKLDLFKLIGQIGKGKGLTQLLSIILIPEDASNFHPGKLKNAEMLEVIKDFFTINPELSKFSETLKSKLPGMMMSQT